MNSETVIIQLTLPAEVHREWKQRATQLDTTLKAALVAALAESVGLGSDEPLPRDRRRSNAQ